MLPALLQLFDRPNRRRGTDRFDTAINPVSAPDNHVWTADLTYWVAGQPEELVAEKGWQTEAGHLELCRELGCMPYYWYEPFWAGERLYDQVSCHQENGPERRRNVWETSIGRLVEESQYLESSHSQAITHYPVQDPTDLKILLYILEHSRLEPVNLDTYEQRRRTWADYDGLPSLGMPRSPLPAFFTEWTGVQNGTYLLQDEPDLVEDILELLEEQEKPVLEAIGVLQPPLVHFPDNLTSEVYTPFFNRHMRQRYERRIEFLHARGTGCAVHLDGTVRGLLPRLAATGIDAIEAITPQPVGDIPLEEVRQLARNDQVILWGGVPGAMFCAPFTWEDLKDHVWRVLDAWKGAPFVLGTADQVPPDGDIRRVKWISELVQEYGEAQ